MPELEEEVEGERMKINTRLVRHGMHKRHKANCDDEHLTIIEFLSVLPSRRVITKARRNSGYNIEAHRKTELSYQL